MTENLPDTEDISRETIIMFLNSKGDDRINLFRHAAEVKKKHVGNKVWLRGLIELSNVCAKDCFYCGIRKSNTKVKRYNIRDSEVLEAARFACENNYGSVVLQSGELQHDKFTRRIEKLVKQIKGLSEDKLGITLSCGEQSEDTYKRWYDAGAHRYLLRIETSARELYEKIHPSDQIHIFDNRIVCLERLKKCGYQTGTGVMIGLPFQNVTHLADDLIFMKNLDIDMCGMGPYIEHSDTPLYRYKNQLLPIHERFDLSIKMVAVLRIMMPYINIASTTALQAIEKTGREKAIQAGANILMPNITPGKYRDSYSLYENKPCTGENAGDCLHCLDIRMKLAGADIAYGEWGDSLHYGKRSKAAQADLQQKI
ncbi:MAG: [FeFe] hydrogenase H-cluster radical SAM maturase HydE [Bacteroidales bacterium]|nr:[FeFe] hydrogenase H-cluster radical SAM maturase HydE [Bacteroidales bacterium]